MAERKGRGGGGGRKGGKLMGKGPARGRNLPGRSEGGDRWAVFPQKRERGGEPRL